MINGCGAVGGMIIGKGNLTDHRKPTAVLLCPSQIPHDLTWNKIQAAMVGSQHLSWCRQLNNTFSYETDN
jgi:hypothetical protein